MAAAARPGASEARVPCPVCGALIHPVAGRCKHCKEDLRTFRSVRPAALVALPRLSGVESRPRAAAPAAVPLPLPPTAEAVAMPSGYAPPPAPHEARSILPPRTTGSQYVTDEPRRSAWRHWPIVVIAVAMVAIIGAFVIMVYPASTPAAGKHGVAPPLGATPDHMDTNPLTPHDPSPTPTPPPPPGAHHPVPTSPDPTIDDPWLDPDRHSQIDPLPLPSDDPGLKPFPGDPYSDPDHDHQLDLVTAAAQHWCRARAACPDGDPAMEAACMMVSSAPVTPPACPASTRCLARFDHLGCSASFDLNGIQRLLVAFDDCTEALRC